MSVDPEKQDKKRSAKILADLFIYGAGKEIRTPDPDLGKVVLYQLSYSRFRVIKLLVPSEPLSTRRVY